MYRGENHATFRENSGGSDNKVKTEHSSADYVITLISVYMHSGCDKNSVCKMIGQSL